MGRGAHFGTYGCHRVRHLAARGCRTPRAAWYMARGSRRRGRDIGWRAIGFACTGSFREFTGTGCVAGSQPEGHQRHHESGAAGGGGQYGPAHRHLVRDLRCVGLSRDFSSGNDMQCGYTVAPGTKLPYRDSSDLLTATFTPQRGHHTRTVQDGACIDAGPLLLVSPIALQRKAACRSRSRCCLFEAARVWMKVASRWRSLRSAIITTSR